VPALPSSILEPLWIQVSALLPARQLHHPPGCHRPRIPDRIIFDKLIQILVFGCGYRRIADATCSASTLRRRRMSGSAPASPSNCAVRCWPPTTGCRLGNGAPGGGRLHHQGALRRAGRRAKSGGSSQAGAETLGRHRGARDPAGQRLVATLVGPWWILVADPGRNDRRTTPQRLVPRVIAIGRILAEQLADRVGVVALPGMRVSVQPGCDALPLQAHQPSSVTTVRRRRS
jgi:hypothetical protein